MDNEYNSKHLEQYMRLKPKLKLYNVYTTELVVLKELATIN